MIFKKIAIVGLAAIMTFNLSGCQLTNKDKDDPNVTLQETHGPLSELVKSKIAEGTPLNDVAAALTDGLPNAKPEDADSAVLLYVKFADSKSADLSSEWIYSTPEISDKFYKVFGGEFNYQWDETRIDQIADQEIKTMFNNINNAYMKIDAYGEYLGPVVNYEKIAALPNLSDSVKTYFTNVSGLYATGRMANQLMGLDYMATAQYAAAMEDTYKQSNNITLKESAASMLNFALNLYYSGTEGSSPFDFEKQMLTEAFTTATKEVIAKYGTYHIGKLGKEFLDLSDANDGKLTSDFADIVINYKKFGFDSNKAVHSTKVVKEPDYFEITPVFTGFDNPAVEERIANEIATAIGDIKENVQWEKTEKTNFHLSYIVDFANDNYFSLQLSGVSYNRENSINLYDNVSMIFDSKTGERITLKEIFKEDYDKNMKKIKELVLKDLVEKQKLEFKTTKNFEIDNNVVINNNYLIVTLKRGTYSDEQQYDLVSYVLFSDLLSTFDMNQYLRVSK